MTTQPVPETPSSAAVECYALHQDHPVPSHHEQDRLRRIGHCYAGLALTATMKCHHHHLKTPTTPKKTMATLYEQMQPVMLYPSLNSHRRKQWLCGLCGNASALVAALLCRRIPFQWRLLRTGSFMSGKPGKFLNKKKLRINACMTVYTRVWSGTTYRILRT